MATTLQQQFGQIDIYLFDQILRSRLAPGMKILDAGCGEGRNLVYLLQAGYQVFGVDQDPEANCILTAPGRPSGPGYLAGKLQNRRAGTHPLAGRLV